MRSRTLFLVMLVLPLAAPAKLLSAIDSQKASAFVGQDLHLSGREVISYQLSTGEHTLVFRNGFSMSVGANKFSSDSAVVWLESVTTKYRGVSRVDYRARAYLQGDVSVKKAKGALTTDLSRTVVEEGKRMVVGFEVSGEVFITADERKIADPRGSGLYKKALAASQAVIAGPAFVVQPGALVPELQPERVPARRPPKKAVAKKATVEKAKVAAKPRKPGFIEKIFGRKRKRPEPSKAAAARQRVKKPRFEYPVNIAPVGEVEPRMEWDDRTKVGTLIGRFYMWQKQDEKGGLLELQADNAVIFYYGQESEAGEGQEAEDVMAKGSIKAVYVCGDVVMTEGQRIIRADEMYYDFQKKKAIAINAVMRNFDVSREIPIYVRAAKMRQLAENKFAAENITLTSSEFYLPQISLNASSVIITDTTTVDAQMKKVSDSSFDAEMRDVRWKVGRKTIFYWPFMRSNLQRPDIPLKSAHAGHDNTWGTSFETRWYLSRLLGLREPQGTDSTLELDYYSKRGIGGGVDIDYKRDNYFGRLLGYVIHDSGEDRLGSHKSRKDLEPDREIRGRFSWLHRHFLPFDWQLTTAVNYLSDENFLESYYRREFNTGEPQETYIHLKRLQDNWALSFLGKGRINSFADELEEMPSAEFHLTGKSLFNDKFTLYSDTEAARLRQKIGKDHSIAIDTSEFSFMSHRTELDMPIKVSDCRFPFSGYLLPMKVIPFVAGTFGYDDRSGFTRERVDGRNTGKFGEETVLLGEVGVRVFPQPYWKVYPNVKSRLWDLNQLRHIIKPQLTAVLYAESDPVVDQHDTLNIGISQRLQTKRGIADKQRTVDWMRLDTDVTWVSNSDGAGAGPDRFIWNSQIVPLRVLSAPDIFNGDLTKSLHRFEKWGPRRNYFGADYIWRISDTTAVLSDMNFDMQSGVVQQFNIGFSRLCWPNLSYYIGSRYLRRVRILDEEGSNAFTFALTYVLDPRYTLIFAQQYDFDYGANIQSDITLIRRYHRMYCGFTFSADAALDRQSIVFSIWPQGVPELGIGSRRHVGLVDSAGY